MIAGNIALEDKYRALEPKFEKAFAFLRRPDLASLPVGRIDIDGSEIFALVQEYDTKPAENGRLETHDKHFDVQYIVEGEERFGVADRAVLEVDEAYSVEKDITFYREPAHSGCLILRKGDFAVVAPEDAHKPCCAVDKPSHVKKIVIKVKI